MSIITYKARFIAASPRNLFENAYINIEAGAVKEVYNLRRPRTSKSIDLGDGIIIPALINTHTHLELSAFKDQIPYKYGFKKWVEHLLSEREKTPEKKIIKAAEVGIKEILNTGSAACGEISTLGITKQIFMKSLLAGVWFEEKLGDNIPVSKTKTEKTKSYSYAGHAPHTTSPQLLTTLKKYTRKRKLPFSIHTSESEEEFEFITTGKGEWARFLTQRGINYKSWRLPAESPVLHLEKLRILDKQTILVHLLFGTEKDLNVIKKHNANISLCPRSNQNLHNRLPDIKKMIKLDINLCLGTDSLASVPSLDITDETAFIAEKFPEIPSTQILAMATINGAKALAIDKNYGTIEKGKKASFLYIPVKASSIETALEAAINKDIAGEKRFILEGEIYR